MEMKKSGGGLVVALVWLAMAMMPEKVAAVDYTVGEASPAWTTDVDYTTWTSGKTFLIGDNLIFTYSAQQHDVMEVTEADYASCITTNGISKVQTGNDRIALTAAGTRYFICSLGNHCTRNMKISITTVASTPSPPSTTPTTPTPPSSITPPTTTTPSITQSPPSYASHLPQALTPISFALIALLSFLFNL